MAWHVFSQCKDLEVLGDSGLDDVFQRILCMTRTKCARMTVMGERHLGRENARQDTSRSAKVLTVQDRYVETIAWLRLLVFATTALVCSSYRPDSANAAGVQVGLTLVNGRSFVTSIRTSRINFPSAATIKLDIRCYTFSQHNGAY